MTQLRNQLEAAKKAYENQKYPGNLANDLLASAPIPIWRAAGWRTWTAAAVAACAGLVLFVQTPFTPQPDTATANSNGSGQVFWTGQVNIVDAKPAQPGSNQASPVNPSGGQVFVGFNQPSPQTAATKPSTNPSTQPK